MTRAMLNTANLGNKWWGRAMTTAAYLRNLVLSKANKQPKTPYELFSGVRPKLGHIRTFGSKVYIYNDDKTKSKLDDRALEGIMMGYGDKSKGYVIYLPDRDKLVLSRNVKFLEETKPKLNAKPIRNEIENDEAILPRMLKKLKSITMKYKP